MNAVTPEVKLLAITPNAENLIEEAGRTCYLSFYNITDDSQTKFIPGCIKRGHESILEHASATFRIKGGSRAFTHQLVRHRIASFSQQSQRYVKEDDFNYIIPPEIKDNPEALKIYTDFMNNCNETYKQLAELGIKKQDARFVLPNALESEIVFSANFRELRNIFKLRLSPKAQWEIRQITFQMLTIMKENAPSVFGDFELNSENFTAKSSFDK